MAASKASRTVDSTAANWVALMDDSRADKKVSTTVDSRAASTEPRSAESWVCCWAAWKVENLAALKVVRKVAWMVAPKADLTGLC
jgi:hypothetical protein